MGHAGEAPDNRVASNLHVKCLQRTVKDAYHIICKPCALQLELCAKCGKKEDIVLPIATLQQTDPSAPYEGDDAAGEEEDDLDFDLDLESDEDDGDDGKRTKHVNGTRCKKAAASGS
ncbi:hypothetical protein GDO78_006910 [Eleutherodactylus coqui]|uniref:Uncharacterized protein n=1 Tax=Eleutherodactylus coqui TaxID=57060 RepID=A0A8J6KC12_ELECQ|nr:hypothetical protein GDO78_006910 [Eleutherodactylus coqui]